MRGEIIALHSAGSYPGAQLYIGCVQLRVTGGSSSANISPTVSFPGAYKPADVTTNIYNGISSYTIPGRKYPSQKNILLIYMILTQYFLANVASIN